jgi:hypothetical protein
LYDEKCLDSLGLHPISERIVKFIIDSNVHMNTPTYTEVGKEVQIARGTLSVLCGDLFKKGIITGNSPLQYGYFLSYRKGPYRYMDMGPKNVVDFFNDISGTRGTAKTWNEKLDCLTSKGTGPYSVKFLLALLFTCRWGAPQPVYDPCFSEEPMKFIPRKLP